MINYDHFYTEKGPTLAEHLESVGVSMTLINGTWYDTSGQYTDEELNSLMETYNPWPLERKNKWVEIQTGFKIATEQLTQGTIDTERSSWSMQEAEARAWVLNNATPTPALSVLATARGVPLSLLVEKVIQKADLYKTYYFYFQGVRDKLEDQIKAFTDDMPLSRLEELRSLKYEV